MLSNFKTSLHQRQAFLPQMRKYICKSRIWYATDIQNIYELWLNIDHDNRTNNNFKKNLNSHYPKTRHKAPRSTWENVDVMRGTLDTTASQVLARMKEVGTPKHLLEKIFWQLLRTSNLRPSHDPASPLVGRPPRNWQQELKPSYTSVRSGVIHNRKEWQQCRWREAEAKCGILFGHKKGDLLIMLQHRGTSKALC